MKFNFLYLILAAFLVIFVFWLYAQVDHTYKTLESQINSHNERHKVLEIPPQTGQDEEKTKLSTQLAEANTKLINTGFDKLKLELKESNQQWLWGWTGFLGVLFAVFGVALWFVVKSLIADRVEERLNGFKEAVEKVKILENQLKILKKEHAASVLENFNNPILWNIEDHPEQIKALTEEVLLDLFEDKTRDLGVRIASIEVLAARKSPLLVSPVLTFLNIIVDSDINWEVSREPDGYPRQLLTRLSKIHNEESYQGLKSFLNRLIKDNPKNKNLFLPWTVFSLAHLGVEMEIRESVDMLKKVIPEMKELKPNAAVLRTLAEYFNKFQEPEGIMDILNNDLTDNIPAIEKKCLKLLQKHDPEFVKEWKEKKKGTNTESENIE